MSAADLAKLGDALDVAEREWDAAHPNFPGQSILWSVKVDKAFARYRKAVRNEVTKRHRKPSEYVQWIMSTKFPDDSTSLRQFADAEAQRILSSYNLRLHADFQDRVYEKRKRRIADERAGIVRRIPRRKPSIRSV